nr:hypothetical protein Q903MT_gene1998 [Picea sitchensis]
MKRRPCLLFIKLRWYLRRQIHVSGKRTAMDNSDGFLEDAQARSTKGRGDLSVSVLTTAMANCDGFLEDAQARSRVLTLTHHMG